MCESGAGVSEAFAIIMSRCDLVNQVFNKSSKKDGSKTDVFDNVHLNFLKPGKNGG